MMLDLREEAERRATEARKSLDRPAAGFYFSPTKLAAFSTDSLTPTGTQQQPTTPSSSSSKYRPRSASAFRSSADLDSLEDPSATSNLTPKAAKLAEIDYKWNGSRAKYSLEGFIPPRWIPDETVTLCTTCKSEFDWVNRKHHCRHCGQVFCETCCFERLLLPAEYGYNDPQRVCIMCAETLRPLQRELSCYVANHMRTNHIDVSSAEACSFEDGSSSLTSMHCNVQRYLNTPYGTTLAGEIRKAAYTLHNILSTQVIRDKAIPLRLIHEAKGLAFLTVLKAGFIFAPKIGTGLVVSRLADGSWSAPCAVSTFGIAWGAIIGAEVTDYVIVLNTEAAVEAFMSSTGQVTVGAELDIAIGPLGRTGSADIHISDLSISPAVSYSQSRGLFAGVSLEGTVILTRGDVNHIFYGRPVTAREILNPMSTVPPPRAGDILYTVLHDAISSVPDVHHASPVKVSMLPDTPINVSDDDRALGLARSHHDQVLRYMYMNNEKILKGEGVQEMLQQRAVYSSEMRTVVTLPPASSNSNSHNQIHSSGKVRVSGADAELETVGTTTSI